MVTESSNEEKKVVNGKQIMILSVLPPDTTSMDHTHLPSFILLLLYVQVGPTFQYVVTNAYSKEPGTVQ